MARFQVDEAGNWLEATQAGQHDSFHHYHSDQMVASQAKPSESITYDRAVTVEHGEHNFPVIASITTGCRVGNNC